MKKSLLFCSLLLLGGAGFIPQAAAQYDRRIDVPEIVNQGRDYREGRDGRRGDWDRRARMEINRLLREVREVRMEIGGARDRRIRARFHEVTVAADRLNYLYNSRRIRPWEVRERAEAIRARLYSIRRDLRERYYDRRGR